MKLGDFLVKYKEAVKDANSSKRFSSELFAKILEVDYERLKKWEKGAMPSDEKDRNKLKEFFGVEDLSNIPEDFLEQFPEKVIRFLIDPVKAAADEMRESIKNTENATLLKTSYSTEELQTLRNSTKKGQTKQPEVIVLGKNPNKRMREEDFAGAFPDWKGLPVFNAPVTASFVQTYRDESIYEPIYHLRDPRFKDCNFAAIVTGDSMYAEIRHGDYVVCQEIDPSGFIVYGDIYYIVSKGGLETCKYVNAFELDAVDSRGKPKYDFGRFILSARNESITPSPIDRVEILKLYKVKGIIRGY